MSVFSRTAFFSEKKAPAAKLKEYLGFHKEPIRSQGTDKVTRNRKVGFPKIDFQIPKYQIPKYQISKYQIPKYQIPKYQIPNTQVPNTKVPNIR